jgi:hypothetical protein
MERKFQISTWNRSRSTRAGVDVQFYSFFNLGTRWGKWSTPYPGHFFLEKDPVNFEQEPGWAPGPVWTGAENLASDRDSIPGPSRL